MFEDHTRCLRLIAWLTILLCFSIQETCIIDCSIRWQLYQPELQKDTYLKKNLLYERPIFLLLMMTNATKCYACVDWPLDPFIFKLEWNVWPLLVQMELKINQPEELGKAQCAQACSCEPLELLPSPSNRPLRIWKMLAPSSPVHCQSTSTTIKWWKLSCCDQIWRVNPLFVDTRFKSGDETRKNAERFYAPGDKGRPCESPEWENVLQA